MPYFTKEFTCIFIFKVAYLNTEMLCLGLHIWKMRMAMASSYVPFVVLTLDCGTDYVFLKMTTAPSPIPGLVLPVFHQEVKSNLFYLSWIHLYVTCNNRMLPIQYFWEFHFALWNILAGALSCHLSHISVFKLHCSKATTMWGSQN